MGTLRVLSTDCQGPILPILQVLAVCHCSILPLLRVYSQYFGLCTFILPALRVFRGSILLVMPVHGVIWEDTASIGNILVLRTADIIAIIWAVLCSAVSTIIPRVLAALEYTVH